MLNFDNEIEKYRRELLEFSRMSKINEVPVEEEEREPEVLREEISAEPIHIEEAVPASAEVTQASIYEPEALPAMATPAENYADFLAKNSAKGQMKVQVTIAGTIPLPNANVSVSAQLADGERELYNGYTDIDGIIDPINLPAPPVSLSYDENGTTVPYAVYTIRVTHPDFSPAEFRNAPVFDSIKSIQPVTLVPITENGDIPGKTLVQNPPMELFGGEN